MSQDYTIKQAYDIAMAFITDRDTTAHAQINDRHISYTFEKRFRTDLPYCLTIYVERGAPEKRGFLMDNKRGHIMLQRGTATASDNHARTLFSAYTDCNAGRAVDKNQSDIVRFGTRMLSPRFFKLLDMAEKRVSGKIKTMDNSGETYMKIYRILENQR